SLNGANPIIAFLSSTIYTKLDELALLCVVHSDESAEPQKTNGNELWIFDAADLKSGPQYKLWHEQFNVGFTIHTAWLPQIKQRNASYCIEVRDDYADILNQQSPTNKALIQDLFENWVYPKKEPETEQKSEISGDSL
ncbi:hypothetical protein NG793_14050, partial [Laspinema sp. C5]|nr:hypothetical protein [Laspinema sp. D3c]